MKNNYSFSNLSPIVLFVYNRLWHTKKTIEALQNNTRAQESILYIFSDGHKNELDEQKVKDVRAYLRTITGFKEIYILEKETNVGLASSIIKGVTTVVNQYGKVIVIEDDIVTSPYFLQFMNDALEKYSDQKKVMHISGSVYPINTKGLPDTFLLKPTTCWGWATWSDRWQYFKKDANYYMETFTPAMIRDFNLDNNYNYFDQIHQNAAGAIQTWAVFWYASVYVNKGLSLHPAFSFVQNIGHDGNGTHSGKTHAFDTTLHTKYPLTFTENMYEHYGARRAFQNFFRSIQGSPLFYLWRKIKCML